MNMVRRETGDGAPVFAALVNKMPESTVQYFNVSMMKCRANECRCTLGYDEDVKASHNKYAI